MIPLVVKCKKCGKELNDKEKIIDEHPAVKLKIVNKQKKKSFIWLSSVYGSHNFETKMFIDDGEIVDFFCPHCNEKLPRTRLCELCSAPMVCVELNVGGDVEFCTRKGCKNHLLEFKDTEKSLKKFFESYSPFLQKKNDSQES